MDSLLSIIIGSGYLLSDPGNRWTSCWSTFYAEGHMHLHAQRAGPEPATLHPFTITNVM